VGSNDVEVVEDTREDPLTDVLEPATALPPLEHPMRLIARTITLAVFITRLGQLE